MDNRNQIEVQLLLLRMVQARLTFMISKVVPMCAEVLQGFRATLLTYRTKLYRVIHLRPDPDPCCVHVELFLGQYNS